MTSQLYVAARGGAGGDDGMPTRCRLKETALKNLKLDPFSLAVTDAKSRVAKTGTWTPVSVSPSSSYCSSADAATAGALSSTACCTTCRFRIVRQELRQFPPSGWLGTHASAPRAYHARWSASGLRRRAPRRRIHRHPSYMMYKQAGAWRH